MSFNISRTRNRPSSEVLIRQRLARTIRMWSLLKSGPIYNTERLAEEFSVSQRTVYRDLQTLRNAGVPILTDKRSEAYYVRAQREPGQMPLENDQVVLLALAAHLSPLNCSPRHATRIRSAISALMDRLPHSMQLEVGGLLSRTQGEAYSLPNEVLDKILSALRCQQRIDVLMETERGVYAEVEIAPCHLVASVNGWQLFGQAFAERNLRSFDVRSFLRVTVIEQHAKFPAPRGSQASKTHSTNRTPNRVQSR